MHKKRSVTAAIILYHRARQEFKKRPSIKAINTLTKFTASWKVLVFNFCG